MCWRCLLYKGTEHLQSLREIPSSCSVPLSFPVEVCHFPDATAVDFSYVFSATADVIDDFCVCVLHPEERHADLHVVVCRSNVFNFSRMRSLNLNDNTFFNSRVLNVTFRLKIRIFNATDVSEWHLLMNTHARLSNCSVSKYLSSDVLLRLTDRSRVKTTLSTGGWTVATLRMT